MNAYGVVRNTEIMVLLITLNSHFHTNQYKLYSYSNIELMTGNDYIIENFNIILCMFINVLCMVALLYYMDVIVSFTNSFCWQI